MINNLSALNIFVSYVGIFGISYTIWEEICNIIHIINEFFLNWINRNSNATNDCANLSASLPYLEGRS